MIKVRQYWLDEWFAGRPLSSDEEAEDVDVTRWIEIDGRFLQTRSADEGPQWVHDVPGDVLIDYVYTEPRTPFTLFMEGSAGLVLKFESNDKGIFRAPVSGPGFSLYPELCQDMHGYWCPAGRPVDRGIQGSSKCRKSWIVLAGSRFARVFARDNNVLRVDDDGNRSLLY